MSENKPLTVAELIPILQEMNPEAILIMEGCDCNGYAWTAEADTTWNGKPAVYLARSGGVE